MNPAVVISSYWTLKDRDAKKKASRKKREDAVGVLHYEYATPIDSPNPELDTCLRSLERVAGLGSVVILVVAPPEIEAAAVKRVHDIAAAHGMSDVVIVDSFKAAAIREQYAQVLGSEFGEPIGFLSRGALRNLGLLACCVLDCDVAVFIDDDGEVMSPDFLVQAVYGLGAQPRTGAPVMVKSGYYLDYRNSALADRRNIRSYDRDWPKRYEFNEWMTQALSGPRISRSNMVCGACFAVHAEAFTRVAFDPWIARGEDTDYLFNLYAYGVDVWFDNAWRLRRAAMRTPDSPARFEQDIYRWVYTRRKIEVLNSNIDLHKILPEQFMPYPGKWIGTELADRIRKTAKRRTFFAAGHLTYMRMNHSVRKAASAYAELTCTNYMHFLSVWNKVTHLAWKNEAMAHILRGQGMLNPAVAQYMNAQRGAGGASKAAVPGVVPVADSPSDAPDADNLSATPDADNSSAAPDADNSSAAPDADNSSSPSSVDNPSFE